MRSHSQLKLRGREKETSPDPFTQLRLPITRWTRVRVCINTCLYSLCLYFGIFSCAWHTRGSLILA